VKPEERIAIGMWAFALVLLAMAAIVNLWDSL
jgi:hypothetical protein